MKFVLTGATGFVGAHLHKYLQAQGHLVATIGRGFSQSEMIKTLQETKPDVVIHLASCFIAEHKSSDVDNLIQSNILFGSQLLEAMKITDCRTLINTGSTWQQYKGIRNNPACLYAATKNAFEEILKYYVSAENFNHITLKLVDSYGPEDKRGKLVSKLIESLVTGQCFELSPGEQKIDLVHINDIVKAYEVASSTLVQTSHKSLNTTFTLSTGQAISIRDIVRIIENISNQKLNVTFGAREYRKREMMDSEVLDPILPNWSALITLQAGLKGLIYGH
jgi:CDP-3, 6-dideoxy-D-glycero-L-glycero-4-hexulose-4-reductase